MQRMKLLKIFTIIILLSLILNINGSLAEGEWLTPQILTVTPEAVIPGETIVTVAGRHFGNDFNPHTLFMNDTEIFAANWSYREISFLVPEGVIPGHIRVRALKGEDGGYTDFFSKRFFFKPVIKYFSRYDVRNEEYFSIFGSNLRNIFIEGGISLQVWINGYAVGEVNIVEWEDDHIKIIVPKYASTGLVVARITSKAYTRQFYATSTDEIRISDNLPIEYRSSPASEITIEELQEDGITSFIQLERRLVRVDESIGMNLIGKILLQVEANGEGWYVNPDDVKKYYLGRPDDAFEIMRKFGLGIKHAELENYLNSLFPSRLSGKILLDIEENGEAYYIDPITLKGHFLGRPGDAFRIMREFGLGITNLNIRKIEVGEI